jgi:glycosyltransferase involved in cell wall biosynthesis
LKKNISKKINFILPFYPSKPGGGTKIMYEYANRLAANGYGVSVIHAIKRPFKKSKTPVWFRYLILKLRGRPTWFKFHPTINWLLVTEVNNQSVPDADATVSTWWQMAYSIHLLQASKGKKINLIQDYETWSGNVEKVHESYTLPIHHVVIAKYLFEKVVSISGIAPTHIPNAIDTNIFNIQTPIDARNPHSVVMLYSEEPRKGSNYGIRALTELKKEFPLLEVSLFSVYKRTVHIPNWMNYHYRPDDLVAIYNRHAIFLSPSLGEGWALPPAEAMACGCAVTCTNIGGHRDYAIHGETALLVSPENVEEITAALKALLVNQTYRVKMASQGHLAINSHFSWEMSVKKFETVLQANQ